MCVKIPLIFLKKFVGVPRKRQEKARKNGLEKGLRGQKYEGVCAKERAIYPESAEAVKGREAENGKSKICHRTRVWGSGQPFRPSRDFDAAFAHYRSNDCYYRGKEEAGIRKCAIGVAYRFDLCCL